MHSRPTNKLIILPFLFGGVTQAPSTNTVQCPLCCRHCFHRLSFRSRQPLQGGNQLPFTRVPLAARNVLCLSRLHHLSWRTTAHMHRSCSWRSVRRARTSLPPVTSHHIRFSDDNARTRTFAWSPLTSLVHCMVDLAIPMVQCTCLHQGY